MPEEMQTAENNESAVSTASTESINPVAGALGAMLGLSIDDAPAATPEPAAEVPATEQPAAEQQPADEAPATAPEDEPLTEEESKALIDLLADWKANGGEPAPVQPEQVAQEAPAQPEPTPAPQQTVQQTPQAIPQYISEIPQEVSDALFAGDPTPLMGLIEHNTNARHVAFVGEVNNYFRNALAPAIGNMVETAVTAALIEHANPELSAIRSDVIQKVNEYRVQNPNSSISEATKAVTKKLEIDKITASALAKAKKQGFNFVDMRKGSAPAAPRPNARTNATTRSEPTPQVSPVASAVAKMLGL